MPTEPHYDTIYVLYYIYDSNRGQYAQLQVLFCQCTEEPFVLSLVDATGHVEDVKQGRGRYEVS